MGKEAAKDDPENAGNVFQNYLNSYQAMMSQKKEKAKEKASNTNINVAITKEDSMFKNISLPGGISTKATEYKQLAAKGDRWESPIFSIGSASASSDVPKLRQVTRKPHGTSRAKIQGGNHPNSASSMSSGAAGTTGTDYGSSGAGIPQSSGFSNQVDQAFDPKRDVTGGRGDMTN